MFSKHRFYSSFLKQRNGLDTFSRLETFLYTSISQNSFCYKKKDNLIQVLLKQIVKVTFDQVLSVNLQKKVLEKATVSGIFVKIDF